MVVDFVCYWTGITLLHVLYPWVRECNALTNDSNGIYRPQPYLKLEFLS